MQPQPTPPQWRGLASASRMNRSGAHIDAGVVTRALRATSDALIFDLIEELSVTIKETPMTETPAQRARGLLEIQRALDGRLVGDVTEAVVCSAAWVAALVACAEKAGIIAPTRAQDGTPEEFARAAAQRFVEEDRYTATPALRSLVRAAKADRNATQDGILPARFRAFALNVQHLTACDADLVDDIMSAKRGRGGAPAYAATQAAIDATNERLMTLVAPLVADALDAKGVKNTPLWAIQYVLSDPAATFEALA